MLTITPLALDEPRAAVCALANVWKGWLIDPSFKSLPDFDTKNSILFEKHIAGKIANQNRLIKSIAQIYSIGSESYEVSTQFNAVGLPSGEY